MYIYSEVEVMQVDSETSEEYVRLHLTAPDGTRSCLNDTLVEKNYACVSTGLLFFSQLDYFLCLSYVFL